MSWNSVIGQERIKGLFKKAIEQKRLAHAYLFSGPPGVGKSAFAIELAKVLQCEHQTSEACDTCSSCKKFQTLQHPNLYLIFALPPGKNEESGDSPLEKLTAEDIENIKNQIRLKAKNAYHQINVPRANFIKVNSIREIRKTSALKAYSQGIKVFIILNAEEMNAESSNALLKTLEEPHEDSMFILTTSSSERMLSTISSRCQEVRFESLSETEIAAALQTLKGADHKRALLVARRSNGNMSRALELFEQYDTDERFSPADFLRTILYKSKKDVSLLIDKMSEDNDRTLIEQYLMDVYVWLSDALMLSEGHKTIINIDDEEALEKFITYHTSIDYPSVFESIERAISLLNKNVYIPLLLMNLIFDLRNAIISDKRMSVRN